MIDSDQHDKECDYAQVGCDRAECEAVVLRKDIQLHDNMCTAYK
jgi:hypothetical protein